VLSAAWAASTFSFFRIASLSLAEVAECLSQLDRSEGANCIYCHEQLHGLGKKHDRPQNHRPLSLEDAGIDSSATLGKDGA
jgi:hypothetical protein